MERNTLPLQAIAAAINPPASRQVFEQLTRLLTPPHNIALQPTQPSNFRFWSLKFGSEAKSKVQNPGALWATKMGWAYQACADVIKRHSKSFYFSARLLPPGKREGIMALYAFCRLSDDIVDNALPETQRAGPGTLDSGHRAIALAKARLALDSWARANAVPHPGADHPVILAWADTRARYAIPEALAEELITGVRMDLTIDSYDTWDDLWVYCYRVASTVGLMSMYITGAQTMEAVPYAVQLGVALQLTNILRDVGDDARAGRIYLPREDMERFGYTTDMLMSGTLNRSFVELMKFEIARARALYRAAAPGIKMLPPDSRLAVSAASALYEGILGKIEEANYDVFSRRAHLSAHEKVRALPRLWWRCSVGAWRAMPLLEKLGEVECE